MKAGNLITAFLLASAIEATGQFAFENAGFEQWSAGLPDSWSEVMDTIGRYVDNVTVEPEQEYKSEGFYSARVYSIQPFGGISQPVMPGIPALWNVYPDSAKAAVHYSKANGTSAFLDSHQRVQENFELPLRSGLSSSIRNIRSIRIDNGDYIELFSASSSCEQTWEGAVFMKRNGGEPQLFIDYPQHRTWAVPGIMDMGDKYVFVSTRLGWDGQQHLFATDVSRDFEHLTNDRLLFDIDSTNVQCYSMLKLDDGTVILPFVYADADYLATGPWFMDILLTKDFKTIERLNEPRTYAGRGLMEPYPVKLKDGNVAILCRTDQRHIAKLIFEPKTYRLWEANSTEIMQPDAGAYAVNLSDGSVVLSWLANLHLRKVLVMAVSDDDLQTWQSYHVIITSKAMGHSMTSATPYIHQPYLFEEADGSLVCYFEEVFTESKINLYSCVARDWRINNVANEKHKWQEITVARPAAATDIQLLNIIGSVGTAHFDQPPVPYEGHTDQMQANVYPNPAKDILRINSEVSFRMIELTDLEGNILFSHPFTGLVNSAELSTGTLKPGCYMLKMVSDKNIFVRKVIKIF